MRSWTSCRSELERFLLREHPEWTDEVGSLGASSAQLHGGFVEEITVDAKTFLDRGDAWFAAAPIRWVHLTGARPHLDALLASGLLGRLLWIDLSGQELDDACIEKLATARCLGGVRALSLVNNRITDAGVRTLWTAPPLRELQHCGLAGNPCSPLAVEELTPEYYAQYEWVSTELGVELAAAHGTRTWALRGFTDEPPTLDVLAP